MLHLHFSNRLPALIDRFIALRAAQGADVFASDVVIVPNLAVRRAVQLSLTDREGISANLNFDNLARWLWRLVGRVVPEVGRESPFRPESLTWHVLAVLEDVKFVSAHPRLASYLGAADPVMSHALAARIAGLFDQYTTYRSEWLAAWADGRTDVPALPELAADRDWQAALWRALLERLDATERHPVDQFLLALAAGDVTPHLPPALHLMALPSIPPPYLDLLRALSAYTEVHLYSLNPCEEYWADIITERRYRALDAAGHADGYEVAHPLLAAWGGAQQAYFTALVEHFSDVQSDDSPLYVPPVGQTRLAHLQRSILDLKTPHEGEWLTASDDRSLEIHVCHSLTRQLEVALERLLGLFDECARAGRPLRPHEVLIAVPDIESAAPLVDAVFAALPDNQRISYMLTGRRESKSEGVSRAFLTLLDLAGSRLEADALHGFLLLPLVRRRFGFDNDALDTLRDWIHAAGYRYGIDAAHHAQMGLPSGSRVSLSDGLDRLFLSYVLPADEWSPMLEGLLPAKGVRDPDGDLLAALARCTEQLATFVAATAKPKSGREWSNALLSALDTFFLPASDGEDIEEFTGLRSAIRKLCALIEKADPTAEHPLGVIRAGLLQTLDGAGPGGVPGGAVTVSSLAALRGLSYRALFVLGLDDGVFPRVDRSVDFDLIAKTLRPGDRQRRSDDRNVFLDHLVATTDVLHLSYTGFNDRTNAALPPSVLVAELLDLLVPAVRAPGELVENARRRIVVVHPLQPFSPTCFDPSEPRRQSHNAGLAGALRMRANNPAAVEREPVFFDAPIQDAAAWPATLPITTLAAFYRGPARVLLEQTLGLRFDRAEADLPVIEPLSEEQESHRHLERQLLDAALAGIGPAALQAYTAALPDLPAGRLGRVAAQQMIAETIGFADLIRRYRSEPVLPPQRVQASVGVDGAAVELSADWSELRASGLLYFSQWRVSAVSLIETWVQHLLLNLVRPSGVDPISRHLFKDDLCTFSPVSSPQVHLADLLRHYRQGLVAPLPFYPKTSLAYAKKAGVSDIWKGNDYGQSGESNDPLIALAVRGQSDPLGAKFESLSDELLRPLVGHLTRAVPAL
jgi:exodeoxyribonuclease V gamma subunit